MKRQLPARAGWWFPGAIALVVIALLTVLPLLALIKAAGNLDFAGIFESAYFRRVIRFSFYQALLSALLSTAFAIVVAQAFSRRAAFPGRSQLLQLYSLSLVIPTIVAIFGIVAVYGRTGWFNTMLQPLGLKLFSIYGLAGILLAHVFFNMPLATRIFAQSLDNIPSEQWRLATQLRMSSWAQFRWLEWPAMRSALVGVFMLVFTLCFTSFAIVMTLGGGPRATTIEVAIYQALRFDFDLESAVTLAIVQLVFCTSLLLLSAVFKQPPAMGFGLQLPGKLLRPATGSRWVSNLIILVATLFVVLPLLGLLISAINPATIKVLMHEKTIRAVTNTTVLALAAAILSVLMGLGLLITTRHLRIRLRYRLAGQWLQHAGNVILVMPPIVLGTGLFVLLRHVADVFSLALLLAMLINSLMALPFVLRILDGPLMQAAQQHDRLLQSLNLSGWNRWRFIDWPLIRKPLGFAMAVAATFAAGDLSAIALFGSDRALTLPLLLYQRMGSYRLQEAAVTAAILLLLCLLLFLVLQAVFAGGRQNTDNADNTADTDNHDATKLEQREA